MQPIDPLPRLKAFLVFVAVIVTAAAAGAVTGPYGVPVRVNGKDMGLLPLEAPLDLPAGVHRFECQRRGHEPLTELVIINDRDEELHVRLRPIPLRRGRAVRGSVLYAGLGQWYNGATLRGWVYFTGETVGLLAALAGELQRVNYRDDYRVYKAAYDTSFIPADVEHYRILADQAYSDMNDMADLRDTGLYVALGSWALSLLDAWLLFPSVDAGPGLAPPAAAAMNDLDAGRTFDGVHAAVRIGF
jgi:hypothetical protein